MVQDRDPSQESLPGALFAVDTSQSRPWERTADSGPSHPLLLVAVKPFLTYFSVPATT